MMIAHIIKAPINLIIIVVLVSLTWISTDARNDAIMQTGYPCVGEPSMVIPMDQVCDAQGQCPLHDDEYYCKSLHEHDNPYNYGCKSVIDSHRYQSPLGPCCERLPCLTNVSTPNVEHCFILRWKSPSQYGLNLVNLAAECNGTDQAFQCVDGTGDNNCPLNCSCCPLIISCKGASWGQLMDGFNTSVPTVRILIISNLLDAKDRNWAGLAGIFPNLRHLQVSDTPLTTTLQNGEFASFRNLDVLLLNRNGITRVEPNNFSGLNNVTWLTLEENNIMTLGDKLFLHVPRLTQLSLFKNPLSGWADSTFKGLDQLHILRLTETNITSLNKSSFRGLVNLDVIHLYNTPLTRLEPGVFESTPKLTVLHLVNQNIETLEAGTFDGLTNLNTLLIDNGPLKNIKPGVLQNLSTMNNLSLALYQLDQLKLNRDSFDGLDKDLCVFTDSHKICCLFEEVYCEFHNDVAIEFDTCDDLLPGMGLRVFIWIMAILAIVGNLTVIKMRSRRRNESSTMNVQRILILNLAVSDLLMGIYMLIIAIVDIYYNKDFFWYADEWRSNHSLCKLAGFLALLSCQTSIFIVTTISIERFIILVFPFGSRKRLRRKMIYGLTIATWLLWTLISIAALARRSDNLYGNSNVCIGLPLSLRKKDRSHYDTITFDCPDLQQRGVQNPNNDSNHGPAWLFSIIVFICVNSICLVIIFVCYLAIFISVKRARHSAERDADLREEIKMAAKMGLIVGTDFFCWFPVIVMGILSQSKYVPIPEEVYAWVIVFVLPLNSALNPYIYTLNGAIDLHKRQSMLRSTISKKLGKFFNSKGDDNDNHGNGDNQARADYLQLAKQAPQNPAAGALTHRNSGKKAPVDEGDQDENHDLNPEDDPNDTMQQRMNNEGYLKVDSSEF